MSAALHARNCGDGRACRYPHCECPVAISAVNTRNARILKRAEAAVNVLCALIFGVCGGLLIVFELGGWPAIVHKLLEVLR